MSFIIMDYKVKSNEIKISLLFYEYVTTNV